MRGGFMGWVGVAFVVCAGASVGWWGPGPVIATFVFSLILGETTFSSEE